MEGISTMLKLFFKGIVIGVANIMPGVSGGTLAVILGVYDKLTEAIGNFLTVPLKKKIEYLKFLGIIGIGAGIGIGLFAKIIEFCFTNYPKSTASFFSLLIIPSIPYIVKGEDKSNGKNRLFFILGALFTLVFVFLDYFLGGNSGGGELVKTVTFGYCIKLFICGSLAAGAMIIPGISGSLLLLMIGEYYNILGFISGFFDGLVHIREYSSMAEIINNLYILPLAVFALGVGAGLVVVAKIINMLLSSKHRSVTLFFIAGIIVVSILQIWVNIYK